MRLQIYSNLIQTNKIHYDNIIAKFKVILEIDSLSLTDYARKD